MGQLPTWLAPALADTDADRIAGTVTAAAAAVLLAPIVEELFFSGALQRSVHALAGTGRGGAALAIAVSTVAFTLLHALPYGAAVPLAALAAPVVIGIGAGVLTAVTGRLAAALTLHLLFNLAGVVLLL